MPRKITVKDLRGAKRRDATVGRALARDLARLQDRGAGGMAPLAARAPPLTLRRAARAVGRGGGMRVGADVARRDQRKAAGAPPFPGGQPAAGR